LCAFLTIWATVAVKADIAI